MIEPYLVDELVTLYHGDCLDVLRELPDASVDAVVTDPPYGLEFMGKEWDAPWKADASASRGAVIEDPATERGRFQDGNGGNPYSRSRIEYGRGGAASIGFQEWCEQWAAECLRVLKPGGHLLAFGGTRTWHRLACAIEDAGFEVRDSIAWMYGSGFPKSLDVSKAIDKQRHDADDKLRVTSWLADMAEHNGVTRADVDAHMGTSDMGGWWLSRLRHRCAIPTLDQVPRLLDVLGIVADDVPDEIRAMLIDLNGMKGQPGPAWFRREVTAERTRKATGRMLQGEGGYAFGEDFAETAPATPDAERWQGWGTALKPAFEPIVVARKPLAGTVAANVLAHGTGALNVDGCRVEGAKPDTTRGASINATSMAAPLGGQGRILDDGRGRWPANVILDESQAAELDEQSGVLTSGANPTRRGSDKFRDAYGDFRGQEACVPSRGADSGGASRFFYVAKADQSERVRIDGVAHPTVKPLALMRWLVRLVTPPGGTVLEPFAGSGTTVEACVLEGFRCVAIEREADYLSLIRRRIMRRTDTIAVALEEKEDLGLLGVMLGIDQEAADA